MTHPADFAALAVLEILKKKRAEQPDQYVDRESLLALVRRSHKRLTNDEFQAELTRLISNGYVSQITGVSGTEQLKINRAGWEELRVLKRRFREVEGPKQHLRKKLLILAVAAAVVAIVGYVIVGVILPELAKVKQTPEMKVPANPVF